ncbi:MAG: translocation/assembly module TamB domain-containing protein [Pseudochelatococcus sp.]|jgi:translocation and assembly module TamB|uniref:translocation/assembly module TamB domain-containing protein n=1 Tax=Pseudochelatococcus sp. TaxID=2020869 RepID=UPI003D89ED47
MSDGGYRRVRIRRRRRGTGVGGLLLRLAGGVAVAAVAGFFFMTRTDTGRAALVEIVEGLAGGPDLSLSIGRLEGAVPFDMTVRDVRVADGQGVWLDIDRARLAWRPLALLSGVLDIAVVEADRVAVARAPVSSGAAEADSSSAGLPQLPFGIRLNELKVGEVALGPALFGQEARLAVNGSAELVDLAQGLDVDLAVDRIDGQQGRITGRFGYAPEGEVLTLDVLAQEPAGGIVSQIAGVADLPPLTFSAKGGGPLDDWRGQLLLDLAGKAGANGELAVRRQDAQRVLTASIDADIAALLPDTLAPLAGGRSALAVEAHFGDDGKVAVTHAQLDAAAATLSAQGHFDPATQAVSASARVTAGAPPVFAHLSPEPVSWSGATLDVDVGGTLAALEGKAELSAGDLAAAGYRAQDVRIAAHVLGNGPVADEATKFDLTVDGDIAGIAAPDAALTRMLGGTAKLTARASADRTLVAHVDAAHLALAPLSLRFSGIVDPGEIIGKVALEKADLAALRPFAGPDLAGSVRLDADVDVAFDMSRLSVMLDGAAEGLRTGVAQADGLTGGRLALSGGVTRAQDGGFGFKALKIDGAGVSLAADGSATQSNADVVATLTLPDLGKIDRQLQGRGEIAVTLTGNLDRLDGKAAVSVPQARAAGRPIEALKLDIVAGDLLGAVSGTLALGGAVDGRPARGAGRFSRAADGAARIDDLDIALGSVSVRGAVALDAAQLATGRLNIAAGNLADLSPLLLTELGGQVNLQADLSRANGGQNARIAGNIDRFAGFGASLRGARIEATGRDLLRQPVLDARIEIAEALAGGVSVPRAVITARGTGQATDVRVEGVAQGADVTAAARVTPGATTSVVVNQARLSRGNERIEVAPNARIDIAGGAVRISGLELRAGAGRLRVAGEAGERLDVNAAIRNFPLGVSELFAPGLGLAGTVSGEANVTGAAARPDGRYRLNVAGITLPAIADAGLRPLAITASGALGGGRVTTDATIRAQNDIALRVQGSAPLGEGDLDLTVTGPVDLGIANTVLSASGQTLTGRANVDLRLRGTAAAPAVGGTVRVAGGQFVDPVQGLFFDNIQAVVTGSERELVLTSLSARTRNGGVVNGAGRVAVDPAAGFPGNITIRANRAQLVASEMVNMVSNLDLAITGPLAHSPRLAGAINVDNLQINIPNRFPLSLAPIVVQHVHPPPRVRARIEREEAAAAQATASTPFVLGLDIAINAPARVFVRGQGINAELGGTLKVRGDSSAPVVDGGFQMRRGTLAVVGRTLTFSRGEVSFVGGSLDPMLDFLAEAPASDVTAQIGVTGYASNPELSISSRPELPRDEVFARLLFGRPVTRLTTSQTIRLAQAVAQLTGVGGGDALGTLGRSLGVDSVDVGADDSGNVDVGIGKRINDNIYLGVKQGATPASSRLTVDVDITDHIKLQGEAGADGSSAVGIGMEWDY